MPGLLRELESDRLVVAVDPGKVSHRVWLADRERGLIGEPVSVANSRVGIERLAALVGGSDPVFAVEATGRCIGRSRGSLSGAGRERCGCLRRQRRMRRVRRSVRAGLGPATAIARRWSGSRARARGDRRRFRRSRRCWLPSHIVVSSCSHSSRCVSGCMISSTRSLRDCRRPVVTAARCCWRPRPGTLSWPVRSTSPGARRARGR